MLTVYIAVIKSMHEYFLNLFNQRFEYLYDEMQQNGSKDCNLIVLASDQTFVTFQKPVIFYLRRATVARRAILPPVYEQIHAFFCLTVNKILTK
jgi:hypothetical protein